MDTWYYAKRCFCALIETLAKHLIVVKDTSISEILDFLDAADQYGKAIKTVIIFFLFFFRNNFRRLIWKILMKEIRFLLKPVC